jgi:Flp pilus assembly protein TadG
MGSEVVAMLRVPPPCPWSSNLPRRLAADQRGVTAIVTALGLVVLMGFAGMAIDVGAWLTAQRGLQSTADQGAYSAADAAGSSSCASTEASTQARAILAGRGYINGQNGVTVAVSCDPSQSTFTVRVSQQQPLWFSRIFLSNAPTVSASATAQLASKVSDLCVLALDGTNVAEGVTGSDASSLWLSGNAAANIHCGVAVDSSNLAGLSVGGSSSLTASDLYLIGNDQGSPSGSSQINVDAAQVLRNQLPVEDPYANRAVPPYTCLSYGMTQLDSGTLDSEIKSTYCGGLSLGGTAPSTITVKPGVYVIVGGSLTFSANAQITGTGVTFVLTGNDQHGYATLTISGGPQAAVSLTAPPSGPYGGMAFFQDRNAPFSGSVSTTSSCTSGTSQNQLTGGSTQLVTGAVYFPNQSVCYSGGSDTSGAGRCTQLIAHTLSFTGNSGIEANCAGTGVEPITVATAKLIQ